MGRIYGLETEYGLIARTRARDGGWRRVSADEAARLLFVPIAREHATTSVFLPNGGRLYLDVGNHPEYATPECATIADLQVAERAGDDLLVALAERARAAEAAEGRDTEFTLVKNNVDSFGTTYGSHENYLVGRDADPVHLAAWLVPFLVSRQAIAGAGRWRRGAFTVSQRCDALAEVMSSDTTRSRPLINTRDEPHADPRRYRRLHVISGDSNLDEATARLRWAATELVLRLAESGRPAPIVLDDPLAALRAWGRDPEPAVALQRRYAALAAEVADGLDADLDAWQRGTVTPEWAHKRRLLIAYRDRHHLADADPRLDALDLRWHVLGSGPDGRPAGLARLLEARGELPRLTAPDAVASALQVAPGPGRARLRGRLVAAARAHGRDVAVDWASVTVHDLPASVALDDPFADADPRVDALVEAMGARPRRRPLGGFVPPPA
nr:Pup--protein ligase [Propionibacterium sp.]